MGGRGVNAPFGTWDVNGWHIRIAQGKKAPGDRRIDVAARDGQYCTLSLAALGAITALWYRNEDLLYPPPAHGGQFVLDFLAECCRSDLETACRQYLLPPPRIRRVDQTDLEEAA